MKKWFILFGIILAFSSSASTVYWQTTNWLAFGASPTAVTITQVGDTPFSAGNFIIVGPPKRFSGGSGTNIMAQGMYRLDLAGFTFAKPFYFVVPDDTNTYNVAQLRGTNAPTIPTITPRALVPASVPSTITFLLTNFCQSIPPPTAITLTQLGDAPLSDGSLIIVGLPKRITSTSPGQFSASLFPSYYRLDIDALTYAKPFLFVVPSGGTNYNAAQLRVTNTAPSLVPNLYPLVSSLLTNLSGAALWLPDARGGMSNAATPISIGKTESAIDMTIFTPYRINVVPRSGFTTNTLTLKSHQFQWTENAVFDGNVTAASFTGSGSNLTDLPIPPVDPNTLTNNYAGTITATAFSGDGSALTALNGSQITSGTLPDARLANTGTAGTYTKVNTDAKGRVTSGTTLSAGDVPAIAESGVTGLVSDLAGKQAGPLTGDVTTSGAAATLKNTGTAGTYTKTTFDAQGRETSGASATLASSDFANQGTTTTVLHGNASGNPSFAAVDVSSAEITGTLKAGEIG